MAKMPDSTALGQRPTPDAGGRVARIPVQRDQMGEELQHAGGLFQQASQIVEQTNLKQDTIAAEDALNRLQQQRISLEFDPNAGFRNAKEGNATGRKFLTDNLTKFDDAAALIAEGLANDQQRALFKQRVPVVGLQYRSALFQHQASETERFNDATDKSSLELLVQGSAMQPTNDMVLKTSIVRGYGLIDEIGQRKGLPPETVTEMKAKYSDALHSAPVSSYLVGIPGVIDANPYTALSLIEKNREKMLPGTVLKLTHEATTAIKVLENQKRTANDAALKEAQQTMEQLGQFALSGQKADEGYKALVRTKVAGTPFAERAEDLLKQADLGSMHGSQTIPRQEETIRAAEVAAAQNGTNPDLAKVLAHARQITDTQIRAYKENPWEASARFQRLPSVPDKPLASADAVPQYVSQVKPLMTAIETAAGPGINVSPLQPNQAKAFTDQLRSLPPGPRADVLGQTGAQLSASQIQGLADQIDKAHRPTALALKMGADQTNAGRMVSELVLRGSQAIEDKAIKRDDSTLTGWRADISRMVRGTLGDAQAEQDVIDAAYYVRAAMDHEGSSVPGFNLTASNENAVKLVIGQPMDRAGVKTILPRGMDESAFTDKVRAITIPELDVLTTKHSVWVRGQQRTLEQLHSSLPGMGMKRDGRGRYIPVSGGALVTIDPEGVIPLRLEIR